MIFRQFLHADPVGASYLFGCGGHGVCAVVDPFENAEPYVRAAADTRMQIRYVIETHVHADHVSGGRALAKQVAGEYLVHDTAVAGAKRIEDDERLTLGNVTIQVLHTPGHTPEHICLLVTDRTRGDEPWLILTGHTLMVGDMGRTELTTAAEAGAAQLYDSMQRLRRLPDHVEVWPGAFAGSVCGRALSGKASSTIGFERRFNRAFRLEDRQQFIEFMLRDIPAPPPRAKELRELNRGQIPGNAFNAK